MKKGNWNSCYRFRRTNESNLFFFESCFQPILLMISAQSHNTLNDENFSLLISVQNLKSLKSLVFLFLSKIAWKGKQAISHYTAPLTLNPPPFITSLPTPYSQQKSSIKPPWKIFRQAQCQRA
jgi:hypothetical protein